MAKTQIPCKTCGKPFTPCAFCADQYGNGAWRAVACSLECGAKYFDAVIKARTKRTEPVASAKANSVKKARKKKVEKTNDIEA